MDNRNNGYGPLMLFLSQMMQSARQNPSAQPTPSAGEDTAAQEASDRTSDAESREQKIYFAEDETACVWRRQENLQLLSQFCREGYAMARRHGHYLVGTGEKGAFLAIPGRFLLEEQPAGGITGFTLWQPLNGGESHYDTLETMSESAAETVYGYWIARLDPETLKISEV